MEIKGNKTLVFTNVLNGGTYEMPIEELTDVIMWVSREGEAYYRIGFLNDEFEVSKEDYDWCIDYLKAKATKNERNN